MLIAIQVLFWVSGGLIMSALKLEEVRGEHLIRQARENGTGSPNQIPVPSSNCSRADPPDPSQRATLTTLLDRPVYRLESANGAMLFDAVSGAQLSPLPEAIARQIALADYAGSGALAAVEWVDQAALEYRGRDLPLWRLRFDDERETTLYVSPSTGQVVARRNDLWRLFDFVWMLHIMDYEEREDFNHPLLVTTAATTLLFVITGIVMLGFSFKGRRAS
ncbi:MAG: PepSY domain-containing protein [Gammaproteobacteria bacterium]